VPSLINLPDLVNLSDSFQDSKCNNNNLKLLLTTANGETNTPCKTLEYNEKLKVKFLVQIDQQYAKFIKEHTGHTI